MHFGFGGEGGTLARNVWAVHLPVLFPVIYGTPVWEESRWWDQPRWLEGFSSVWRHFGECLATWNLLLCRWLEGLVRHPSAPKTLKMGELKAAGNWLGAARGGPVFGPPCLGCEARCAAAHCAAVWTLPRRPGLYRPAATPGTSWWCTGSPKGYGSQGWGSLSIWAARTANPERADHQCFLQPPIQHQEDKRCNNRDINGSGGPLWDPCRTVMGLDLGLVAFRWEIINAVMWFWMHGTNMGKILTSSSIFCLLICKTEHSSVCVRTSCCGIIWNREPCIPFILNVTYNHCHSGNPLNCLSQPKCFPSASGELSNNIRQIICPACSVYPSVS